VAQQLTESSDDSNLIRLKRLQPPGHLVLCAVAYMPMPSSCYMQLHAMMALGYSLSNHTITSVLTQRLDTLSKCLSDLLQGLCCTNPPTSMVTGMTCTARHRP